MHREATQVVVLSSKPSSSSPVSAPITADTRKSDPSSQPTTTDIQQQAKQPVSADTTLSKGLKDGVDDAALEAIGIDGFLLAALRNPKDRIFMLKLDKEMESFLRDESRSRLEFPQMNSYQRLVVHRVAAYFKLSHVVDSRKQAMILNKTPESALPLIRLYDLVEEDEESQVPSTQSRFKIMRRNAKGGHWSLSGSADDGSLTGDGSPCGSTSSFTPMSSRHGRKIKTLEEREAEYLKARARIFQDQEGNEERSSVSSSGSSASESTGQLTSVSGATSNTASGPPSSCVSGTSSKVNGQSRGRRHKYPKGYNGPALPPTPTYFQTAQPKRQAGGSRNKGNPRMQYSMMPTNSMPTAVSNMDQSMMYHPGFFGYQQVMGFVGQQGQPMIGMPPYGMEYPAMIGPYSQQRNVPQPFSPTVQGQPSMQYPIQRPPQAPPQHPQFVMQQPVDQNGYPQPGSQSYRMDNGYGVYMQQPAFSGQASVPVVGIRGYPYQQPPEIVSPQMVSSQHQVQIPPTPIPPTAPPPGTFHSQQPLMPPGVPSPITPQTFSSMAPQPHGFMASHEISQNVAREIKAGESANATPPPQENIANSIAASVVSSVVKGGEGDKGTPPSAVPHQSSQLGLIGTSVPMSTTPSALTSSTSSSAPPPTPPTDRFVPNLDTISTSFSQMGIARPKENDEFARSQMPQAPPAFEDSMPTPVSAQLPNPAVAPTSPRLVEAAPATVRGGMASATDHTMLSHMPIQTGSSHEGFVPLPADPSMSLDYSGQRLYIQPPPPPVPPPHHAHGLVIPEPGRGYINPCQMLSRPRLSSPISPNPAVPLTRHHHHVPVSSLSSVGGLASNFPSPAGRRAPSTHSSASTSSSSISRRKKKHGLLFDYNFQESYEGVKPDAADEPIPPSHILEIYDIQMTPEDLMDTFTIPHVVSFKRLTETSMLAIFKNSTSCKEALDVFPPELNVRIWTPIVYTSR